MRLNKYIALCGAASRRAADRLIEEGKVTVNGSIVIMPGLMVDETKDTVCVVGSVIRPQDDNVYIMLNKPAGFLCSCSDDRGRKTVTSLIDIPNVRLFPVGRLDLDTEGLLLLTNDGDFAYKLTHPKHEVNKKYFAIVSGELSSEKLRALRCGLEIEGGKTSPAQIEVLKKESTETQLYITIHEGKNRQIKRMFSKVGCNVKYLKRTAIGRLEIGNLKSGSWRYLTMEDMQKLGI